MSKRKETASSVMWDRNSTTIFCDICLRQIELGNRLNTYFNKEGCQNVIMKFKELTGKEYDRTKFKNKWDQLKRDWKLWKELKRGSTGLGWDPMKRTIDAPEEWWVEKLQVVPAAKKFKMNDIDPVLEEKMDGMFAGVVATGTHSFVPSENEFTGTDDVNEIDDLGASGDGIPYMRRDVESTSGSKRSMSQKKNAGPAFVRGTIDKLLESIENLHSSEASKQPVAPNTSIKECLEILKTNDEVMADNDLFLTCVTLLQIQFEGNFFWNWVKSTD